MEYKANDFCHPRNFLEFEIMNIDEKSIVFCKCIYYIYLYI